jgi:diacylglycerol kinase family enzyme
LYASKVRRLNAIKLLLGVLTGKHLKHYAVYNLHAKNLEISTNENNPLACLVYGDGEFLGQLPVKIQLGNKVLKVLIPKKS